MRRPATEPTVSQLELRVYWPSYGPQCKQASRTTHPNPRSHGQQYTENRLQRPTATHNTGPCKRGLKLPLQTNIQQQPQNSVPVGVTSQTAPHQLQHTTTSWQRPGGGLSPTLSRTTASSSALRSCGQKTHQGTTGDMTNMTEGPYTRTYPRPLAATRHQPMDADADDSARLRNASVPSALHISANTVMEVDDDFQDIQHLLQVAQGVQPKQPYWSVDKALDVAYHHTPEGSDEESNVPTCTST